MNWLSALRDAWGWFSSSVSVLSIFSENRKILFLIGILLAVAVFIFESVSLNRGNRIQWIATETEHKSIEYQFPKSILYWNDRYLWLCYKDDEKCFTLAFGKVGDKPFDNDFRYFIPLIYFDEQQNSRPAPNQDEESQYYDLKRLYLSKTYIEYEGSVRHLSNQK